MTTLPAVADGAPTGEASECGEELQEVLLDLLRAESPNPPGDVAAAVATVLDCCDRFGLPFTLDSPASRRTNIVIEVHASGPGRHLIWNGHLDTFPAVAGSPIPRLAAGRVHGRGAVDMKGGVAAFLVAARRLRQDPDGLSGTLTLVLVCDEETFGPHGARGLLARRPDLLGDALVSTEPSSLGLVRIGERGLLWLRVTFPGTSLHSAYPDAAEGAILRMAAMVRATRDHVEALNESLADSARDLPGDEALERHLGSGAARISRSVSFNVGTVRGGTAVNMRPDSCEVTLDLRVPSTVDLDALLGDVTDLARDHDGRLAVLTRGLANSTAEDAEVVSAVVSAVEDVRGEPPALSIGIGCTDTRLWRNAGVPACVIGPSPQSMGRVDEFVELEELEQLVEILERSARSYLAPSEGRAS